jgi:hypothetical protein
MNNKENIEIKKSRNGMGAYATADLSPKDRIIEVKGLFMDCNEDDDIPEEIRSNTIRYDREKYISPQGELANYLNHSCDPNSYITKRKKRLYIVALQDIAIGEEVTFDYSTILAPDDSWEMNCNCGSPSCRGVVRQFKTLPKKVREKYISLGMVPDYIIS